MRRLFESLAWVLIAVMFLYTVLQSFGVVDSGPGGVATSVKRALAPPPP